MTNREVIWRMQLTMSMLKVQRPSSEVTMSEIRSLLSRVVAGLLDQESLTPDQADTLFMWMDTAPGDDLLEVFGTPSVEVSEDPWPSFGLSDDGP